MVAPGVADVMEMALLPLFCIIGVATWLMVKIPTSESGKLARVAIAFIVVELVAKKGWLYALLDVVGVLLSVV